MNKIRIAGAQLPINDYNVEYNLNEIKKALDWAADNNVDMLQTPECSLSGYNPHHWLSREPGKCDPNDIELQDALKQIEEYQRSVGVALNLGTCLVNQEQSGLIVRNQIRYYSKEGYLYNTTDKTYIVGADKPCLPSFDPGKTFVIPYAKDDFKCIGMICNDMWGSPAKTGKHLFPPTSLHEMVCGQKPDLIFHSTHGFKIPVSDIEDKGDHHRRIRDDVYEYWNQGWLAMTAFKSIAHILTVDACTQWNWDRSEDTINDFKTSSTSGVLSPLGEWVVKAPRYGRQYFYYDLDLDAKKEYEYLITDPEIGVDSGLLRNPHITNNSATMTDSSSDEYECDSI